MHAIDAIHNTKIISSQAANPIAPAGRNASLPGGVIGNDGSF
jgi:hypothetical protein